MLRLLKRCFLSGHEWNGVLIAVVDFTTAAVFAEMAQECYRTGSSVLEMLHELHARYGVFHSIGGYVIAEASEVMERVFSDIRGAQDASYPESIAGEQPYSLPHHASTHLFSRLDYYSMVVVT